jgi:hypothetical protein
VLCGFVPMMPFVFWIVTMHSSQPRPADRSWFCSIGSIKARWSTQPWWRSASQRSSSEGSGDTRVLSWAFTEECWAIGVGGIKAISWCASRCLPRFRNGPSKRPGGRAQELVR